MAKKNERNKKVVGINDIKDEKVKDTVVINNSEDLQEVLTQGLVDSLTDQVIDSLADGFGRDKLLLIRDDISENASKLLKNEITDDQYQESIGRAIINKLAPNNRVYTDNDVQKLIELGEVLTAEKLENIGISKKELRDHVGIFAEHMNKKYGFIKERLQNTVYKFLRDNWKLERKTLDAKLRNLILEESHKHLDETGDERITTISSELGEISVSSIFTVDEVTTDKLIDQTKDLLDKVESGEMNADEFKTKFRAGIRRLEEAHSNTQPTNEDTDSKISLVEETKAKTETSPIISRTARAMSRIHDEFDRQIALAKLSQQAKAN